MRPRSVIRPRVSRVNASVAIRPRADVAARILGLGAERADRPARPDERPRALDERRRLDPADVEAGGRRLLRLAVLLKVLVGDDHDAVLPLVVPHADGADGPRRLDRLEEEGLGQGLRAGTAELSEQAREVVGERADVLLLALERGDPVGLAGLEIEDALAQRADGTRGEVVGRFEVERRARHRTRPARSPSIELSVRTTGPWDRYAIAVIEAGAIAIRWKRSRCAPTAWATAALIGSACDTTTTTAPGWRSPTRASAPTIRVCISTNDSPPGKRKPLGWRCTACHSGFRLSRFSDRPVQAPRSSSVSSRSMRTAQPRAFAIAAAVSRARSSGEA